MLLAETGKIENTGLDTDWAFFKEAETIDTPALIVYPQRVRQNIDKAIAIVGDPQRLRPHFKTAKCEGVCKMLLQAGVTKAKCATIAEAELLAATGVPDVLLAYQPVGPKLGRLLALINQYPKTRFSCLIDHMLPAKALAAAAFRLGLTVDVYIDINAGMNRTGILPHQAGSLYEAASHLKGIKPIGFHVYDGHIKDKNDDARKEACNAAFEPIETLRAGLAGKGFPKPLLIAGGTPTFLIHAQYEDRECSPGTFVYWDAGYAEAFPEQPFLPAALVFTRIVSQPDATTLTLDLGHKAVAAENDLLHRFRFLSVTDAVPLSQSEEHLTVQVPQGHSYAIGDLWAALPYHVCPTVALHEKAYTVENGSLSDEWLTVARNRKVTI